MAKKDFPAWFDSEEQYQEHLAALEAELVLLKARKSPRVKEVEAEIKANGGTVPAAKRATKAAQSADE